MQLGVAEPLDHGWSLCKPTALCNPPTPESTIGRLFPAPMLIAGILCQLVLVYAFPVDHGRRFSHRLVQVPRT